MSAVLEVREPSARFLAVTRPSFVAHFELAVASRGGVANLRQLIRTLAIRGKLVPQDGGDEPATELLARVQRTKANLVAAGVLRAASTPTKIDESELPFELPKSWVWARFGEVSINRDGERVPVSSSDRERRAKVYDYYGASGVIDKIDGYLFDKTLLLIGEDGANLLNRSTPIAFLAHGKYWVNNHAHVIDTTEPGLMLFLQMFINAISLEPYVTGTAQPKMNQAKLNSIVVAIPPLAEQARIVARVDELMRLCDTLEEKVRLEAEQHARLLSTLLGTLTDSATPEELAANWHRVAEHFNLLLDRPEAVDTLEQVILQLAVRGLLVQQDLADACAETLISGEAIAKPDNIAPNGLPAGWTIVRLSQVAETRLGKMLDKAKNRGKPKPYLRNTNVQWRRFDLDDIKLMSLEESELSEFRLRSGDLLICEGGEPGRCAIWQDEAAEMYFQKALHRVRPRPGVSAEYIALAIEGDALSGALAGYFTGATIKHFVGQALDRYTFPLPPSNEQLRIVARVTALRRLCTDLRHRLQAQQTTQSRLAEALVEQATA